MITQETFDKLVLTLAKGTSQIIGQIFDVQKRTFKAEELEKMHEFLTKACHEEVKKAASEFIRLSKSGEGHGAELAERLCKKAAFRVVNRLAS